MAKRRRMNIRGILADPDLRRELMVPTLQATQAREGIETSREQAERAYYVVTEAERTTFLDLAQYWSRRTTAASDRRHPMFVKALGDDSGQVRFDVARRDFSTLSASPLVYAQVAVFARVFREHGTLGGVWANVRGGMNSTSSERFVRYRWEPSANSRRHWVPYSKGGEFARFYSDLDLVFDWTENGAEFRRIVRERYGSESRFVKSPEFYFKRGITWTEKSYTGFSARILPEGAIFNIAGPGAFPLNYSDEWFLLGTLNSSLIAYVAWALCGRSHGATYISALPIAKPNPSAFQRVSSLAQALYEQKASWDTGNETSSSFVKPWVMRSDFTGSVDQRLTALADYESSQNHSLAAQYRELDDTVYDIYGIQAEGRRIMQNALGSRPQEVLWPAMTECGTESRRLEHVLRLLSYLVKRVVEADDDGVVSFAPMRGEASLLERVSRELAAAFPNHDVTQEEAGIANELKKSVKGYRRTASICEWLENAFFEYHAALYKERPIFWHIASAQGTKPAAFGALVHYHRFDKNLMAKLRGTHLRDAIETFRREAALAEQEGRAEDRVEWQAKREEAEELDRRLQWIQEGHHEGEAGGERDFRILTPWKKPHDRPHGWDPDIDDGVKVNIAPFRKAGVLRG